MFFLLQRLCCLSRCLHGVEVSCRTVVLLVDKSLEPGPQTEDSYPHALALYHDIWLDEVFEGCLAEVIVGTDEGEAGLAYQSHKAFHTVIPFVVAYCGRGDSHAVHQLNLHLALEEREVGGTLAEVARVKIEQVGVCGALGVYHCDTAEESSTAGDECVCEVRIHGEDT